MEYVKVPNYTWVQENFFQHTSGIIEPICYKWRLLHSEQHPEMKRCLFWTTAMSTIENLIVFRTKGPENTFLLQVAQEGMFILTISILRVPSCFQTRKCLLRCAVNNGVFEANSRCFSGDSVRSATKLPSVSGNHNFGKDQQFLHPECWKGLLKENTRNCANGTSIV
jgi:hypothetical protein